MPASGDEESMNTRPPQWQRDAMCDLVAELRPSVVSFHFGLPEKTLVARVSATGANILPTATTVQEALWLESEGCDAIIAQGFEGGGVAACS
jgi:nitronate monooxygenase